MSWGKLRWFPGKIDPPIGSASLFTVLQRPAEVDVLKKVMRAGEFDDAADRGKISGWCEGLLGIYYINEGHHRVNAALEILWDDGDAAPFHELLSQGKWDDGAPASSRRFPTRTVWSHLLALLNL